MHAGVSKRSYKEQLRSNQNVRGFGKEDGGVSGKKDRSTQGSAVVNAKSEVRKESMNLRVLVENVGAQATEQERCRSVVYLQQE